LMERKATDPRRARPERDVADIDEAGTFGNVSELVEHVRSGITFSGFDFSERGLAQRFNLTRNAVRETLLSMEGEGSIRRSGRGYRHVDYGACDRATIMYVRHHIEYAALRKAVQCANSEDQRQGIAMGELLKAHQCGKNWVEYAKDDMNFHSVLVAASHDNMLINLFSFMRNTVFRLHLDFDRISEASEAVHAAHMGMLKAFLDRDWPKLKSELTAHLNINEKL